jgi:FAD/FMN-containing dehydrogenase
MFGATVSGFHCKVLTQYPSSVPVSRLPELVYETKKDIAAAEIPSIIAGHAGDGNFHALLLYKTEDELDVARIVADRLVKRALALDGTCGFAPSFSLEFFVNICRRYWRAWRGYRQEEISRRRAGARYG